MTSGGNESLLQPGAGYSYSPKYSKTEYKPMIFIPLGIPTDDFKGVHPCRKSAEEGDEAGDWIKDVAVFKGGTAQFTKFITDRFENGERIDDTIDPGPVYVLYHAVKSASKLDDFAKWKKLLEGGANRGAQLDLPNINGAIRSILLVNADKSFIREPKGNVVSFINQGAAKDVFRKVAERGEDDQYKLVNPVDPDNLHTFTVFISGTDPESKKANSVENVDLSAVGGGRKSAEGQEQRQEFQRWVCNIAPMSTSKPQRAARDASGCLIWHRQFYKPWERTLLYLGDEAQLRLLFRAYSNYPDVLEYAFGANSQDKYYDIWKKHAPKPKVSSIAVGAPAPAQTAASGSFAGLDLSGVGHASAAKAEPERPRTVAKAPEGSSSVEHPDLAAAEAGDDGGGDWTANVTAAEGPDTETPDPKLEKAAKPRTPVAPAVPPEAAALLGEIRNALKP